MKQNPIRQAAVTDAAAVAGLLGQLGYPTRTSETQARLRRFSDASRDALVLIHEGRVVGLVTISLTVVLHRPKTVGRITGLVVDEGARGRGFGKALLAAAELRLRNWGCGVVEVTSNHSRKDAHRFYEVAGYELTSAKFTKAL